MAVYAVSDLHGQYDAFLKGLEEIGFSDNDELIVIGDYAELKPYEHGNFIDIDGGCALGNEYEIDNGALFFGLDDMKAFGITKRETG